MMLNPVILAVSVAAPVATTQSQPPAIACRANALDKAQRQRQQALLEKVRRTAVEKLDLADSLALTFPADAATFIELAEWVSLERLCCPFMGFALEWRQDDRVSVRLTGPPGTKEFIAAEMGIALDR